LPIDVRLALRRGEPLRPRRLPPPRHPRAGGPPLRPPFKQFPEIARRGKLGSEEAGLHDIPVRKCVLARFSHPPARRLDRGTRRCGLVHGRRGTLARESVVQAAELLVAAEVSEIQGRGNTVDTLITLCTAIEEPWLAELFPDDYRDETGVVYDP